MLKWFWTIFSLGAPDFLYNFTLDNLNIFLFPLKVRIIGSRLYMQICFILFLIDRDEMIKIYNTESPMNICFSKHELVCKFYNTDVTQ